MNKFFKEWQGVIVLVLISILTIINVVYLTRPIEEPVARSGPSRVTYLLAKRLGVQNDTDLAGPVDIVGDVGVTGDLTVVGDIDFDGDMQLDHSIAVDGDLTNAGVDFTGPVVFGTVSNVISGTEIAHGLGFTPTTVLLTAESGVTFDSVVFILSTDVTSITVGIEAGTVTTVTKMHWLAGWGRGL